MQTILSVLQTTLAVIFVFGLLIASHEIGHFVVAKLSGVKVLEFALGMGPKLFGYKKGDTNYSLRLLPIGGYVKMLGEEDDSNDPRAVCNINPWKRMLITIAGAFMNFVLAIVLFTIVIFNTGMPVGKPIVGEMIKDKPAIKAGIMTNDEILFANDKKIVKWSDFTTLLQENKGNPINIIVLRNGAEKNITVTPEYNEKESKYLVGVYQKLEKGNLFKSLKRGTQETFSAATWMVDILINTFKGKVSLSNFGGPVAVVQMSGEAARLGILELLSFAGALSINLGIINMLPFPALDGGWVLILLFQAITGKKINENKLGYLNLIGFVLLFGLMILVSIKDVMKIFNF